MRGRGERAQVEKKFPGQHQFPRHPHRGEDGCTRDSDSPVTKTLPGVLPRQLQTKDDTETPGRRNSEGVVKVWWPD